MTLTCEAKPITWIGFGRVLVTPGRRSAATAILVRKSALADNVPHRDQRITKGHSLFLNDVLIPAVDAEDESLAVRFHAFEHDNGIRWTDGDATLPATLFADIDGACQLEILVGATTHYPLFAEAGRPPA